MLIPAIVSGQDVTEKWFTTWGVLFKNETWLSLGSFTYLQTSKGDWGLISKALTLRREV